MSKRALLFDLDGTLLDSAPAFLEALDRYCDTIGKPVISEHRDHYASAGARMAMAAIHQIALDHPELEQHREVFLTLYLDTPPELNRWYPGMDSWLVQLTEAETPWGIVTNKPRPHTEAVLNHLLGTELPTCLVCQGDLPTMKPEPEMLFAAAEALGLAPEQCLYSGDHLRDVQAARAAGMAAVACTYGYLHDDDDPNDWQADALAHSPAELTLKATDWLSNRPL
ncbi:MAG: HAD-IA family hydrolase [Saccharospirillum sp.]|nr:HAD-IA family hydrolase [Saccharospirillum sp.]